MKNITFLLPVSLVLGLTAGSASAQVLTATERENQKLVSVDLTTNTVTTLHNTPGQPDSLIIDRQGRFIYSQPLSDEVRLFDPIANTDIVLANSAVGIRGPQDMIIDPTGQTLYVSNDTGVTNDVGNKITTTNLTTLVTTTCTTISRPQGIVFDSAGNLYVVAGFGSATNGIYQLNPTTCAVIRSRLGIDPANQLDGLTFDPSTGFLFATSSGLGGSNTVFKIDPGTLNPDTAFHPTVPSPDGIINDQAGTLYVASRAGQIYQVTEADPGTVTPRTMVPTLDDLGIMPPQHPTNLKTFNPVSVAQGGTSTLTVTITNPNANTALTSVGFPDPLPTGVVIAATPNLMNTCGGTVTGATAGSTNFSLSGGTLAGGASCSVTVTVTDNNVPGTQSQNCVTASSQNGGSATTQTCATLSVLLPPSFTKTFNPKNVAMGGTSTITIVITNPNATTALSGVVFNDPLPIGIVIAATPNVVNNCGGTVTGATAGSPNFSLSGAMVAAASSCTVSVNVVDNNMPGTASTNCIPPATTGAACDTLNVIKPPTLIKSFTLPSIPVGGTSVMSFTVTNPNTNPPVALSGIGFTDPLPAGVAVAATPNVVNTCGGTLSGGTPGSTNLSLSGVTLASGASCTLSLNVIGSTAGVKNNTTTAITSTNGGNGLPATATLTVVGPPTTTKVFTPAAISTGGNSTLSITILNPNTTAALTGVGLTDPLPAGVAVAATPNVVNTCSGTLTGGTAGSTNLVLSGVTLAAGASCTLSLTVVGSTVGVKNNTTSVVTSNEGGPGAPAAATLTVTIQQPTITKAFNPNPIVPNGTSTLTLTLSNPNATPLTGVAVTDPLPAGIAVATSANATNTCGGTLTGATAGSTSIGLANGSLAGGATCTLSVSVTGATPGAFINTTSTVTSNEAPPGGPGTAVLNIAPPVQVTDAYQIQYIPNLNVGDGVINITNAGTLGADPFGPFSGSTGRICVNVYTFSPDEQEISCCSCLVTPNALVRLSARNDLIQNTLTSVVPNSIVVKLLATIPLSSTGTGGTNAGPFTGSTCNAASPFDTTNLAPGLRAWATKLHALPGTPASYGVTEGPFQVEPLSTGELTKLTNLCRFIVGNGSGAGICKTCSLGGLGAEKQ